MKQADLRRWINARAATVSIGPARLGGDTVDAVLCTTPEEVLVIRCWENSLSGDLVGVAGLTRDELAISLAFCPRCGGTGEVVVSFTNEAGHRERDVLSCPECSALTDSIECDSDGERRHEVESD